MSDRDDLVDGEVDSAPKKRRVLDITTRTPNSRHQSPGAVCLQREEDADK